MSHDDITKKIFAPLQQPTTTKPHAMSGTEINALQRQHYRPVNTRDQHQNEPTCPCLKTYSKCQHLIVLPCGHRMHKKCGNVWLNVTAQCPYGCVKKF